MRWTSWRRSEARCEPGGRDEPNRALGMREIRAALEQRGVSTEFSAALASRAKERLDGLDVAHAGALLDGMAMAVELQQATHEQLTRSLRGLREVERMMGAFSGELSKLDEVLEVLAAYVRRMRSSGSGDQDRTLH